ncbi:hypothetical protein SSS_01406 [Sarcoptes scabiei]|uniref:Uncharacterized protein n=1 Tax=Sarcoptes scabiei TaxID=52283 RepID=A0A834REI8_SARSC|nr:hypothetical protein SSS_01406 [Sarcoptes scabiei]
MLYNCPLSICEWPLVDEIFFNRENLFYYVFQAKWVWKIPQIVFHNFTKRKISITSMIPFYLEKLKSNVQLVGQNNLYGKELILMIQNDSVLNALKLDPDSFTIQSSIFFDLKLISPCYQFRLLTGAIGSKRIWIMMHCSSNEFFIAEYQRRIHLEWDLFSLYQTIASPMLSTIFFDSYVNFLIDYHIYMFLIDGGTKMIDFNNCVQIEIGDYFNCPRSKPQAHQAIIDNRDDWYKQHLEQDRSDFERKFSSDCVRFEMMNRSDRLRIDEEEYSNEPSIIFEKLSVIFDYMPDAFIDVDVKFANISRNDFTIELKKLIAIPSEFNPSKTTQAFTLDSTINLRENLSIVEVVTEESTNPIQITILIAIVGVIVSLILLTFLMVKYFFSKKKITDNANSIEIATNRSIERKQSKTLSIRSKKIESLILNGNKH